MWMRVSPQLERVTTNTKAKTKAQAHRLPSCFFKGPSRPSNTWNKAYSPGEVNPSAVKASSVKQTCHLDTFPFLTLTIISSSV